MAAVDALRHGQLAEGSHQHFVREVVEERLTSADHRAELDALPCVCRAPSPHLAARGIRERANRPSLAQSYAPREQPRGDPRLRGA